MASSSFREASFAVGMAASRKPSPLAPGEPGSEPLVGGAMPGHTTQVTVISFCVRVPVLSTQTTVAHPRASTAGSFFTIADLAAMRITPRASVTVTQMGSPSGIAATAKDTPMVNMFRSFWPRKKPTRAITPITAKETMLNRCPRSSMETWSGVLRFSTSFISWKVLPNSVRMPVATTRARAWPWFTVVPMKSMHLLSSPS
mmetsp:Transcript_23417/g.68387  ORF Transcript_23417/g.68387 Transcript_23417/m.68387 type:complete len:201 (-) Transcript_23417:755-1357(-)